ncbi:hypothetical protein ASG87_12920 [Frateuria sp. Soil773]|uniref:hypothetical protein n=1 Tax=Frateuria sp. Soil773 TaxID=1736407 RepID=UPI0006FEC619|nr:hypothetical protein [Frateuria sp. Soil773]KRF00584.1 hypothetical protein ASG87_12920 [Frateuria sp. Soil773]
MKTRLPVSLLLACLVAGCAHDRRPPPPCLLPGELPADAATHANPKDLPPPCPADFGRSGRGP